MSTDHAENETDHESHSKSHTLLMMLCCILPIIAIVAVAALFPGIAYLNFLFMLICPLGMALMMLPSLLSKKKKTNKGCH